MPKIGDEAKRVSLPTKKLRRYSEAELISFGEKIKKFYDASGKFDMKKLSVAFGATTKSGAVIVTNFMETSHRGWAEYTYDRPTRQEQLDNLLDQYFAWKYTGKFIEAKKIEGLQELAEQRSYTNQYADDKDEWQGL